MAAFLKVDRPGWQQHMVSTSHVVTWQLGIRFPRLVPLVYVVGYAKSGTTWASQLVADYLQLPFPRLSLLPVGFPAVVHGHERVWKRYPHCVYILRDGRDVVVSRYFHSYREIGQGDHPRLTRRQKWLFPNLVNRENISENLPTFIDRFMSRRRPWKLTWDTHVRSFYETNHPHIGLLRFEQLTTDGPRALADAMAQMTGRQPDYERAAAAVDKFSFAKQTGRHSGSEDRGSFLRKGQAGDWVNHFTREAAEVFDRHCGEALILAGYEKDRSWIDRVKD